MRQAGKGQGGPAGASPATKRSQAALTQELLQLEKRKLVELNRGTVRLTREGYQELVRRFPGMGRRS